MSDLTKFKNLKNDTEKWEFLIKNKTTLTVQLDNDDTFVIDKNSNNDEYGNFDDYLGWSQGIFKLLSALNIDHEGV